MYFISLEEKIQISSPYQIHRNQIKTLPVTFIHARKLPFSPAELGASVLDVGVTGVVAEVGGGIVVVISGSDVMVVCDIVANGLTAVVPVTVVCEMPVEDRVILLVEPPELGSEDRGRFGS
jgi:hypothetical protein